MALDEFFRELPADAHERVLVAVDCANESRLGPDPEVLTARAVVLDVDHHHDNTRFGDVNLVVPEASSTGEVLARRLPRARRRSRRRSPRRSTSALTDTGRFQYLNTPKALRPGRRS